eukprot:scaffold6068_cov119-Isochrysis_galbana.AAC.23
MSTSTCSAVRRTAVRPLDETRVRCRVKSKKKKGPKVGGGGEAVAEDARSWPVGGGRGRLGGLGASGEGSVGKGWCAVLRRATRVLTGFVTNTVESVERRVRPRHHDPNSEGVRHERPRGGAHHVEQRQQSPSRASAAASRAGLGLVGRFRSVRGSREDGRAEQRLDRRQGEVGSDAAGEFHEELDREVSKRPPDAHAGHGGHGAQPRPPVLVVCRDTRDDGRADQQADHEERLDAKRRWGSAGDALHDHIGAIRERLEPKGVDGEKVLPLARQDVSHYALHIPLHLDVEEHAMQERWHCCRWHLGLLSSRQLGSAHPALAKEKELRGCGGTTAWSSVVGGRPGVQIFIDTAPPGG